MRFETAALLAELDSLAFPGRMRLLATRARELAGSRELGVLLDDLYGGDQFRRQIALSWLKLVRKSAGVVDGVEGLA
jgi:hypothetical protein